MNIRKATPADAMPNATLARSGSKLQLIARESVDVIAQKIEANLRRVGAPADSSVYVAETEEREIAGYCAVHWVPFLLLAGGEGYVTELFVRPADTGQGIGSKLLEIVVAEARRRGCSRLSLLT